MVALGLGLQSPGVPSAGASTLPAGFQESVAFTGLTHPTAVRFASDGRVFVAEKSGRIKVFDGLSDTSPTLFADLSTNVYNFWDRGLLGLALHPNFPATPYVYVAYTYDGAIGGQAPRWGTPGVLSDPCPTPPGATSDGCVVSGRVSRLTATGNVMTGPETVLVEDWCQQYPSHSVGTITFGADGALYVSGGDGASFTFADYGQDGDPPNPCGDPPGSAGVALTPPSAEGGALRSQDLRTSGDPVTLDGTIIRIDPLTGDALENNPLASSSDPNARRIIAYGLRNPFRFTFRPGTSELWIADVGWGTWEEINRAPNPTDAVVENFGWPCYEGNGRESAYDAANLTLCENLYAEGTAAVGAPFFAYAHAGTVVSKDRCPTGSSSISGLSFYTTGSYPARYEGALFFADYSRDCIWVAFKSQNGVPDMSTRASFVTAAENPVNLQIGPGGDVFYVDFDGGTIRRIEYVGTQAPTTSLYLSELEWKSMTNGWGPVERDMSNGELGSGDGGTITLNGSTYPKGLGAHASSDVRFNLGGNCTRFRADVGVDDEVGAGGSVVFQVFADGVQLYDSGLMGGATATKTIDVDVTGRAELRLLVTDGGNGVDADHADWAAAWVKCSSSSDPVPPTSSSYLSDLTWKSMTNGWGPVEKDMSNGEIGSGDGGAITLNGTTYGKGLGAHAASDVRYNLGGKCTRFRADVGVDDEVGAGGSVVFQVFADGGKLYDSGLMGGATATKTIDLDVTGKSGLDLFITSGGDGIDADHADWAAARVECDSGTANTAPTATILAPTADKKWKVGETVAFSGSATDPEDGTLPASALSWSLILHHCPSNCHTHPVQSFPGVSSGSFSAPDHEYPSHLELQLRATDSGGLASTTNVVLQPDTVTLTFRASPSGLQVVVNGIGGATPLTRTVITGSRNTISAPSPQTLDGAQYVYSSWSDGGAQTHSITANASTTYTAAYDGPPRNESKPTISGEAREGKSLTASEGSWSGTTPITFRYQWLRCDRAGGSCVAIGGATSTTYTLTASDVGAKIRIEVTATNSFGSKPVTSDATTAVKRARG